jgi:pimeloyl-ACP methyl ester carboxylesterase
MLSAPGQPTDPDVKFSGEWLNIKLGNSTVRLFIRRWVPGEPNGCVVFCMHGITTTGADFGFLAYYLARRGYAVISPDFAGHGHSTYLGRPEAYSPGLTARCLAAVASHYGQGSEDRAFIGSSWGAASLCVSLAASRLKAVAVVANDFAMEWKPNMRGAMQRFHPALNQPFDGLEEAKAYLRHRDATMFDHRDTDEIAPWILDQYWKSRFTKVNGKYALAFDPCVLASFQAPHSGKPSYPDFFQIISTIDAKRILLLFGEHSPYRTSKVRDRLLAECGNVAALDVAGAGHSPRLLCDRQAKIVLDFIDSARAA